MKKIKIFGGIFVVLALLVTSFALRAQATAPAYNATGNYVVNMEYLGTQYSHDLSLVQDSSGNLTGHGGSPAGTNVYTWVITSGTVSGNSIDFLANYTATADAVTPQTVLHVTGTIGTDGKITGTWSDNYKGGARTGALTTVSGAAIALRTITATAGANGSITPSGSVLVTDGQNQTFAIAAVSGFHVADVLVDGTSVGAVSTYTFTNVIANHTIAASFAANPVVNTFTITASAGADGTISPTGAVVINSGSNQIFTITANSGFRVADVLVDSVSVGAVSTYTFSNVTANHTISASFIVNPVLITGPQSKDDCKKGGWMTFTNPTFRNQGQCVSSVAKHGHDDNDADENENDGNSLKGNQSLNLQTGRVNLGINTREREND
ncbi:MAG: hypothetical protein KGL67_02110 [Patescibacteria group bacterium]|nr:hypothetical protein [Patescibacteria group bacterium]